MDALQVCLIKDFSFVTRVPHDNCVCCLQRFGFVGFVARFHGIVESCLAGGNRIFNFHRRTNRKCHG